MFANEASVGQIEPALASFGQRRIMGNQQQRRAEPCMLVEQVVDDRLAGRAVEIAGRLVGQQQRRAGDKGARDRDTLLLAAGKLPRIMPEAMPEPDPASAASASAKASRRPASSSGIATFSRAVIVGSR